MKKFLKKILKILPLMLLGVVFGFFVGFVGAKLLFTEDTSPMLFALLLVWLYAALLIQTVIHEAGHLVFGLLSGYRFCSFRIGPLMLAKNEGKLKFSKMSVAGTGGQCLLAPPEPDENGDFPTALYNLGGSFLNLISAVIFTIFAVIFASSPTAVALLAVIAMIGLATALLNGIPLRSGLIVNDGYNQLSISRHPEAKAALATQLRVVERSYAGDGLEEMPPEWFELPEKITDPLTGTIAVFRTNRLIAEGKFPEAAKLIESLITKGEILPLHRIMMKLDLVSLELLGENCRPKLDGILTPEFKKQRKSLGSNLSVIRCEYLLARLYDRDDAKAKKLAEKFERLVKSYPIGKDIDTERRLMALGDEIGDKIAEKSE